LVVIDDGSSDGTKALLEGYATRDPRVRLISRPNQGLTKTLNEGLGLARGEFIARMDADDVSLPTRFEKQVEFLRANPDCVCVGARVLRVDPYGSPLSESDHKLTHAEIDAQLIEQGLGWAITHPVAMIRRDAVQKVGGYREQFKTSQDLDLWLRLAEIGRLANLPEILLKYRYHPESVGFTKFEEQRRVKSIILSDAYARRGRTPPTEWPKAIFTPLPVAEQLRRWARTALKANNRDIAKKHAIDALKREPLKVDSWRVMLRVYVLG
jgi:glycosyltransferase involved in cell wall biosynthesis